MCSHCIDIIHIYAKTTDCNFPFFLCKSIFRIVCDGCHLAVPCVRGQEHLELMATVYEDKQKKGLTIVPAIDSASVLWHHSQTGARLHQAGATAPQLSAAISRAGHPKNFLHERCCSILLLRLAAPHVGIPWHFAVTMRGLIQ
jgi:hypothetical protein